MPQNEADFENRLEQALAAYADPEDTGPPRLLTARVLEAVEARRRKRFLWLGLAVVTPTLTCLLLAVLLFHHPLAPIKLEAKHVVLPVVSEPTTVHVSQPVQTHLVIAHPQPKRTRLKLDQFPAPAALSEQERLLVNLVASAQPDALQDIAQEQQRAAKPLHITALNIAPIHPIPLSQE